MEHKALGMYYGFSHEQGKHRLKHSVKTRAAAFH